MTKYRNILALSSDNDNMIMAMREINRQLSKLDSIRNITVLAPRSQTDCSLTYIFYDSSKLIDLTKVLKYNNINKYINVFSNKCDSINCELKPYDLCLVVYSLDTKKTYVQYCLGDTACERKELALSEPLYINTCFTNYIIEHTIKGVPTDSTISNFEDSIAHGKFPCCSTTDTKTLLRGLASLRVCLHYDDIYEDSKLRFLRIVSNFINNQY